jgi:hypothetical protein
MKTTYEIGLCLVLANVIFDDRIETMLHRDENITCHVDAWLGVAGQTGRNMHFS